MTPRAANERTGLTAREAGERLVRFGPNTLVPETPWAALKHWLAALADPMILLLAVAAAVYFALGERRDAWILIGSILPIFAIDVVLEARASKALGKIRELMRPTSRVVREGKRRELPTEELVPGDLIVLDEGEVVPADAALVESRNIEMDESALTGESVPVAKGAAPGESAEVFAGTSVVSGQGEALVTKTGSRTRYGQIAHLMAGIEEERTPFQRKIDRLVLQLAGGAVVACLALFTIKMAEGAGWGESTLSAVSLAIAAVPEEFPVVFTLYLTMGVFRLTRKNTLVRRLAGVETLGSTTVICADKTGTLTEGRLTVAEHTGRENEQLYWETIVLACEPRATDPLEKALLAHARHHGVEPDRIFERWELVKDYPFDPKAKYMSHVWRGEGGELRLCAKGSVEGIAERCRDERAVRAESRRENEELATAGRRVIAVAFRRLEVLSASREENESALEYLGLVGFSDPPRPEVAAAIAECRSAGIRVIMITGDHPLTAHHVAVAIGLAHEDDPIVTGAELESRREEELERCVARANIFARVLPAQKHGLVRALKRRGEIVAMTGDGINDALALREAHIGVAMGRRGTAVARAAATMVLLDDNFGTIVDAIREGRQIFSKIEKAFRYLITFHIPILLLAVLVPLFGMERLLSPVVIIWLELIMHPTVALVFEAGSSDPDSMRKPPRDPARPILPAIDLWTSVLQGLSIGIGVFLLYLYQLHAGTSPFEARAIAVASLILAEVLLVTVELSRVDRRGALANPFYWGTQLLTLGTLVAFLYVPPVAASLQLSPIAAPSWLEALAAALVATLWVEGLRAFLSRGVFRGR